MEREQIVAIMAAIIATRLINDDTFTHEYKVMEISGKAVGVALEIYADTEDILTEPN